MVMVYSRNDTSAPAVSSPASTSRPPCHSTDGDAAERREGQHPEEERPRRARAAAPP